MKCNIFVMLGEILGLNLQTLIRINSSCFKSSHSHQRDSSKYEKFAELTTSRISPSDEMLLGLY